MGTAKKVTIGADTLECLEQTVLQLRREKALLVERVEDLKVQNQDAVDGWNAIHWALKLAHRDGQAKDKEIRLLRVRAQRHDP